jgi:hypothetical protein
MRRLILALTAMLVMTQAHADQRSLADATVFFWDGSKYNRWLNKDGTWDDGSQKGWRIYKTEDPCIVDIRETIGARGGQYVYKKTRVNFRKMPEADAFTISEKDPRDYRSFAVQAEARLPDGALGKDACWTSWRIWDNRGEEFLKHRLKALDYIRNTFCK